MSYVLQLSVVVSQSVPSVSRWDLFFCRFPCAVCDIP